MQKPFTHTAHSLSIILLLHTLYAHDLASAFHFLSPTCTAYPHSGRSFHLSRVTPTQAHEILFRWCQRANFPNTLCLEDPIPTLQSPAAYTQFNDLIRTTQKKTREVLAYVDEDKYNFLSLNSEAIPTHPADVTRFLICLQHDTNMLTLHDLAVAPSLYPDDDVHLFRMLHAYARHPLNTHALVTSAKHHNQALFQQLWVASIYTSAPSTAD